MASTTRLLVGRSPGAGESPRSTAADVGFTKGAGAAEAQRASSLGTACLGLVFGRFASEAAGARATSSSLVSVPCPLDRSLVGVGGRSCFGPGAEGEEGEGDRGDGEAPSGVYGSRVT